MADKESPVQLAEKDESGMVLANGEPTIGAIAAEIRQQFTNNLVLFDRTEHRLKTLKIALYNFGLQDELETTLIDPPNPEAPDRKGIYQTLENILLANKILVEKANMIEDFVANIVSELENHIDVPQPTELKQNGGR